MNQLSHHFPIVRTARNGQDIEAAQRLRHDVFFKERLGATGRHLDCDRFDEVCDHLLVEMHGHAGARLVGTYRLLRQEVAEATTGFYTQQEFDIAALLARKPGLRGLELGRSCVHKDFRSRGIINALWQGIWDYAGRHQVDLLFGCASFDGTAEGQHQQALAFLAQHARAPEEWRVHAHSHNAVAMQPEDCTPLHCSLRDIPPLIRAYLSVGCFVGETAALDLDFGSTDVLIVLPVTHINPRFRERFGNPLND